MCPKLVVTRLLALVLFSLDIDVDIFLEYVGVLILNIVKDN
jgi:hypothetical protein